METETKINVELLERVKAVILKEPRRLDMGTWGSPADERISDPSERPPCGTVACIAGWACIISRLDHGGPMPSGVELHELYENAQIDAMELLGLDDWMAEMLFDCPVRDEYNEWPEDLAEAYLDAETPAERARVTVERIDLFIKTNGAE